MADKGFKRKLSAILSADAVGYSRLMREDEDRTIRTLTTYRFAITALVEKFRGHVVDATGDNLLAEFSSVLDAVNCGAEIQRELAKRNAELPDEHKMQFRIGINLGDVVKEDGRIYGDGVNIAARMESLADPGGICISGSVYDSVESRLGLGFDYLGEQEVKNINKPVRAYHLAPDSGVGEHRIFKAKKNLRKKLLWAISSAILIVFIIIGVLYWKYFYLPAPTEMGSGNKMSPHFPV